MASEPQRTIEHAMIEGIGPVSAKWLLSQPVEGWGVLRQNITDGRYDKPQRIVAKCLMCESPVYIRANVFEEQRLPGFSHYSGGDPTCPWYSGKNANPSEVRKRQYDGQQESPAHRFLCEEIATQAKRDTRYETAVVDGYLAPGKQNGFGRYPDTYVQFNTGKKFVFEVQLSHTQQPEISARASHYMREGIPLIWILHGAEALSGNLPQCFRDVILRHRNNAFVIDDESIKEAKRRKTVVLKAHFLLPSGKFDAGQFITLDDLKYPTKGLPYYEDKVSPVLLEAAKAARAPWWDALKSRRDKSSDGDFKSPEFIKAFADLCGRVVGLADWCKQMEHNQVQIGSLICILFSVVTHVKGVFCNYSSMQPNVTAMLNSKVTRSDLAIYAPIVESLLSKLSENLLRDSVKVHIERAKSISQPAKVLDATPWEVAKLLLPEVFDPCLREQLKTYDGLPGWVKAQEF